MAKKKKSGKKQSKKADKKSAGRLTANGRHQSGYTVAPARISNGREFKSVVQAFDALRNDYEMSKRSRLVRERRGLAPQGGAGDYHIRQSSLFFRDVEMARDADRNDALIGQMIDRACLNIVQDGFTIDFATGDKRLDRDLKQRWVEEHDDPDSIDVAGEMNFHDFQWLAVRSMFVDGDCGIAAVEDEDQPGQPALRLQFYECHQIRNDRPTSDDIVLGVRLSEVRERISYFVVMDAIDPMDTSKAEPEEVEVRDADGMRQFFHVYDPHRPTLTRGKTKLAPVFPLLTMLEDTNFAKLVQQQIVSCFAIFRQQAIGGMIPGTIGGYGAESSVTTTTGETRVLDNVAPGMEIVGAPGEQLQGFSPDVPNPEYFDHVRYLMQLIGVNVGLPLTMVLMDSSETNFSGWRGAFEEAKRGFKHHQQNLKKRFLRPYTKWRIAQYLKQDAALRRANQRSRINVFNHTWNAPNWPYIEPMKDAQADVLRLSGNLTSPRRLMAERSNQWEDIVSETVEDNTTAIRAAMKAAEKLNRNNPGPAIHWREIINLPTPEGVNVSANMPLDQTPEEIQQTEQQTEQRTGQRTAAE